MGKLEPARLKEKSLRLKKSAVENALRNNIGHIAPSLSCADLLVALYYNIMNRPPKPCVEMDHLLLSKAHGSYVYYEILCDLGWLPEDKWHNISQDSGLSGCSERHFEWGIEASCGALGHGLPMAAGLAWGLKLQKKEYDVYCLVGDGELQEGSNWEALQFASFHHLDNLHIIVDGNGLQAMDFLSRIMSSSSPDQEIEQKLEAFGCRVESCNGHDFSSILDAVSRLKQTKGSPRALYAKTIKGYGLKAIENIPKFHYRIPDEHELSMGWRDNE